ncbi:unnamed protein product, partial [Polarella glacialis]
LDVPDVTHVVNYSLGLSVDGYVHRIGRCGRAGRQGTAVTFVTDGDERYAGPLLKLLDEARQPVPPGLRDMAKGFQKSGGKAKYSVQLSKAGGEVKLVSKVKVQAAVNDEEDAPVKGSGVSQRLPTTRQRPPR